MPTITTTHSTISSLITLLESGKEQYLFAVLEAAPQFKGLQFGEFKTQVDAVIKEDFPKTSVSAKTLSNDISAARALVLHFGSAAKAIKAIKERNAQSRRTSFSPQALKNELVPMEHAVKSVAPVKADPVKARIEAAVAAGIITAAQAKKMLAL